MLTWTLIAGGAAVGLGFLYFKSLKEWKRKAGEYESQIDGLQDAVREQSEELDHMENIIHKMEGINREANEEKRKLHSGSKRDNSERATRVMSKLAGDGSKDGDKATPEN